MTPNASHKHLFYAEMAKLLEAGFDIRKAAEVLRRSHLPPQQAVLLTDLHHGLEAGQTITEAFGNDRTVVSDLEVGIIGAGERGGKLAPAFQHLSDYFGMLASVRREVIRSLIYPIIVLHLGMFIATVPMAMVRGDASFVRVATTFGLTLLAVYVVALAGFQSARVALKRSSRHAALDRWLNRLPWVGKARRNLAMARFCRAYHACLLAAIPMNETVRVAADASQSGLIRKASAGLLEVVNRGSPLGPRFVKERAFPEAFARSYATGEEAGTLDIDLARWAKWFQEEAQSSARIAGVMIPKVLYFFILIFVAWKIVGFFNGYYSGMLEPLDE